MNPPRIVLCSLNYNAGKAEYILRRHIESICSQDYSNMEIVFINNGSTDNTKFLIEQFVAEFCNKEQRRTCVIDLPKNLGVATGYQMCYMVAKRLNADYIATINNDVILKDNNVVSRLISVIKRSEKVGALQGILLTPESFIDSAGYIMSNLGDYYKICHRKTLLECRNLFKRYVIPVTYTHAAFSLYSMEALRTSGDVLYFPYFFLFGDDYEVGVRLWRKGFVAVAVYEVVGIHIGSMTIKINPELVKDYEYWSMVADMVINKLIYLKNPIYRIIAITWKIAESLIRRDSKEILGIVNSIIISRKLKKILKNKNIPLSLSVEPRITIPLKIKVVRVLKRFYEIRT